MIRKIRIQGFKSILDAELEIGQVNVFIGANGSGKSNLLEAVGVLSAAVEGRVDDASLRNRGVRLGLPALYKTSLEGQRFRRFITLEATGEVTKGPIVYRVGLDNPIEKPLPSWQYRTERLQSGRRVILGRGLKGMRLGNSHSERPKAEREFVGLSYMSYVYLSEEEVEFLERLRQFVIYTPLTPVLRGVQPDSTPLRPLGLAGGGLAEVLESLLTAQGEILVHRLREMIDWVEKIEILPPSKARIPPALPTTRRILVFTDRKMKPPRNQVSAYDASEGILYVLFTLALALHPDLPLFLAVDNFGYGMHPRLVRSLTAVLCSLLLEQPSRRQVLLTTHDPMVLDGLPLLDDRVRLFAVERDPKASATMVRRIVVNEELWQKKEERGWALSDLWIEGWLGAVPNLF